MTRSAHHGPFLCMLTIAAFGCGKGSVGTTPGANPSITITLNPTSATVDQGGSVAVTGTVTGSGGFNGSVTITVEGVPTGVTGTATSVQNSGTATITIQVGAAVAPGMYTLTARAAANGVTDATATFDLTVTAVPAYTMTVTPAALTIEQAASDVTQAVLARTNFTAGVDLTLEGAPAGLTGTFNPTPVTGDTSDITITVGGAVATGQYTLVIRGTSGGLTDRTDTLVVTVTAPSSPTYGLAIAPDTLTIEQGKSDSTRVTFIRFNFAGTVDLTLENAPAGVSGTFSPAAVAGDTSMLHVTVGAAVPPGTYTLTVRGTTTGLADKTIPFTLIVTPAPAYTMTVSPDTLTIDQGASDVTAVALVRTNFTGDVTLALENVPSGVTGTFVPQPVSGDTSVLTVSVGGSVPGGQYTLVIRGTATNLADRLDTLILNVTIPPGFTLSSLADITIQQGGTDTRTVTITRVGGFTGTVDLTIQGLVTGLTATVNPTSVSGNTSVVTVTAAANLAPMTYIITIRGNATGLTEQVVGLDINVTGSSGSTVTFDFSSCSVSARPVWFAYQDGAGSWTQLTGTNDVYTFMATQSKAGVAYATAGFETKVVVTYGTQVEMANMGAGCSTVGPKTINGTVAGLTTGHTATLSMGGGIANVVGNSAFLMFGVENGTFDFVAASRDVTNPGTAERMIIRRDQNIVDNGTLGTVDFQASEAFTPDPGTMTIAGIVSGENVAVIVGLNTTTSSASCKANRYQIPQLQSGVTSFVAYGVPAANQNSTDFHEVSIVSSALTGGRIVIENFQTMADRTLTLGALLPTVTVTTLTAPYKRLQASVTVPAEYGVGAFFGYEGNNSSADITATAGWLGGTAVTLDLPDFSAVSGWDNNWVPQTADAVTWSFSALGGSTGYRCTEGGRSVITTVTGAA